MKINDIASKAIIEDNVYIVSYKPIWGKIKFENKHGSEY